MDISKLTLNHQSLLRNRMMPTIRSDAKSLQIGKKEEENRSQNPVFPKCDQINMVDVFAPVSPQQVRPNRYGSIFSHNKFDRIDMGTKFRARFAATSATESIWFE
jgi:hypothetical protein